MRILKKDTLVNDTIAAIYKSDAAKLLAVLTRIFGIGNLDLVEDTLQDAFGKALVHWQEVGVPENPQAWLVKTAKNRIIDVIRANRRKLNFAEDLSQFLKSEWSLGGVVESQFKEESIHDDQLRMIFVCCNTDTTTENQLPIILQLLCGMNIDAIARALLIPVPTVKKRLLRTKKLLKQSSFVVPNTEQMTESLKTVHTALYLLFNEGFHGSRDKDIINKVMCLDAQGLVRILLEAKNIANQETYGLCALLHFLMARIDSRIDEKGAPIPIDLQDRSLWQSDQIDLGVKVLEAAQSAASTHGFGRFYVEACIAKEHCMAESFASTNWPAIVSYYQQLIAITQSPVAVLNQAVAMAYAGQIGLAIQRVAQVRQEKIMIKSHYPDATLAHIFAMAKNENLALEHANAAIALGGTASEQDLMMRQIKRHLAKK